MNLTKKQLEEFDKEGYLFFPGLFSQEEIKSFLLKFQKYMISEKSITTEKKVAI